jgi:hypothetical protein
MKPVDLSDLAAELPPPWLFSTLRYALEAAQYLMEQPPWADRHRSDENILAVLQLARIMATLGAEMYDD